MKKIKTSSTGTKLLALLLVVIMAVSLLPMAVLADLFPAADKASTDTTAVSEGDYDRIIMLDCGRKYFTADWIKALIVEAHAAGYTQLQLNFGNDGLRFLLDDMSFTANGTTYSHATVVSKVEAGNEAQNSSGDSSWLTQDKMDEIIACANANGIEIVPMLNLPGHANAILDIFDDKYNANGSNNTLDVADSAEAREIGKAILTKYVDYFAGKGCKYFNFGADEYANDVKRTASDPFSFSRLDSTQYANFVDFVNSMAKIIKDAEMTPRCFNDGLYYNGRSASIDTDIQCCYWSSGWSGYNVASATSISGKGHDMINTNGDYYYVLGKDDKFDSGYSYASNFSNTAFMGSTISSPVGSMFCIWCDYPNAETETEVAQKIRMPLRAMAARMQDMSIDGISTATLAGGFNTDGTINALASSDSSVADTANTINLTVGETSSTYTVSGSVSFATKNSGIANANVTTVSSTAGYQLVSELAAGTYYVSTSPTDTNPTAQLILEKAGDGTYYLKNSNGYIYPTASRNRGSWNYSLGTSYYYSYYDVTAAQSGAGFTFSRSVSSGYGGNQSSTTAYLTLSDSSFGASGNSTTLYLYKYEDTTIDPYTEFTFTGVGEGTTTATVGDTTYTINVTARSHNETKALPLNNSFTLPTGAEDIKLSGSGLTVSGTTVTATEAGKTATVTCVVKNTQGYVTDRYTYTVNTIAEDLSKVSSLTIEYWITNGKVTADGSTSYSLSASDAYGKDGVLLSDIIPKSGTKSSRDLDYWRCRLLDTSKSNSSASGTEKQTGDSGDDDTYSGVGFTKVRYWNSTWSVYTENEEWVSVQSKHQLVAYYLEKLPVTNDLYANAADWGKRGDGSQSGDYLTASKAVTITVQAIYEDGTVSPSTHETMITKTVAFDAWDNGRGVGTVLLQSKEGYKIWKIEAETGTHKGSETLGGNDLNYGSYTISSFTWNDNAMTVFEDSSNPVDSYVIHNDAKNPSSEGYYDNLTWDKAKDSILIKVYLKTAVTEDSLTVEYYDKTTGSIETATKFYSYPIAVAEGTEFNTGFGMGSTENSLVNNGVQNILGTTQYVNANLSEMSEIGSQYRYAEYTLTDAIRSDDGKTVRLYYTFKNTVSFVIDFGLPVQFTLADLSSNINTAQVDKVECATPKYGNAVCADKNTVTYTPTSILKQDDSVSIKITYKDKTSTSYLVNIVPASTVYYEDSFASFTNGKGSANAAWSIDGTEQSANQLLAVLGNDSNLFGYDAAYKNSTTFSMGSAHKVTVSKTMNDTWNENSAWPYAEFKFKGTGFDLISLTNNDSGIITYEVWTLDANDKPDELVCKKFVNNYYGYSFVDGKWVEAASGTQEALYQIPVVKVSNLAYGSYYVKVTVAYGEVFDLTSDGAYSFWLDGVRVYNTRGADYAYYGNKESYPQFIELHNALVSSGDNYQAVMIEGKEDADLTEYTELGPNHEVYIANGQSIAFKLNDNLGKIATVQLGAKAVNGSVGFTVTNTNTNASKDFTIDTATDLYYDISEIAKSGDTVVISTNGSDNLLSLTTVKVTFTEDVEVSLGMTKTEATAAVMYVRSMYAIPAEPFAPEYLKAKWNTPLAVTGKNATLTVTASEDVEAVCVNGEIIEDYTTRTITTGWGSNRTTDTYRVFTYTVTATETADFTVSAFNADGVESDSVTATLYVWGGLGWFKDIIGRLF